jgi:hypothetical protein
MRHRRFLLLLLIAVAPALVVPAGAQQATKYRVDGDRTKSYIQYLCTDQMLGRQSCTETFRQAAEWVAARFKEWGLQPAGENGTYLQNVPIERGVVMNYGVPALSVGSTAFSLDDRDFNLLGVSTAATSVNAPVVFAGYGISAPGKGLDEYAGLDVRGKVVLVLSGSPADAPEPRGRFGPATEAPAAPTERFEAESTDTAKMRTAFQKGAVAVLFYNPDAATDTGMRMPGGGGRGQQESWSPDRNFLAFTVTEPVARLLLRSDPQESPGGTTRRLGDMRLSVKRGKGVSYATSSTVRLKGYDKIERFSADLGNNIATNVIAKIPGTDRNLRSQYVIIGGHLDHLGIRNGYVYNGADDNASGSAVVMEIARVLSEAKYRPRRTMIFCCWCGEELGLLGSQYYSDHPTDGVTMDGVVTYVNMDMVGLGDRIGAPGALNFPEIWEVFKRDQEPDVISVVDARTGGPGGSDHSAFVVRGIEALGLMTSGGVGHPDYHQPEDDTEKIDPEILRKTGQFVLQGIVNLADERRVNLLIPDRVNRYNAVMLRLSTFNPEVPQSTYRYHEASFRDRAGLVKVTLDSALAIATRPAQTTAAPQMAAFAARGGGGQARSRKSVNRGIRDLRPFEGDADLLVASAELLGFGRVDVKGEDGVWFAGGRLTARGREALKAMEAANIVLHLDSPAAGLLRDVVGAAAKPFIVTGTYTVEPDLVGAINQKGVLLGVKFDPKDVAACVRDLGALKTRLGDADNLVLCATTSDGLQEAGSALYLQLIKAGWTHEEIAGSGGGRGAQAGGIAGGNLGRLGAVARMGFPRG